MGNTYCKQGNYTEALSSYESALAAYEEATRDAKSPLQRLFTRWMSSTTSSVDSEIAA